MSKKPLDEVIALKMERGEERIVISMSFKFTDSFELELLRHLWKFNHSHHLKRLIQRDREGVAINPMVAYEYQEPDEEEDMSTYI